LNDIKDLSEIERSFYDTHAYNTFGRFLYYKNAINRFISYKDMLSPRHIDIDALLQKPEDELNCNESNALRYAGIFKQVIADSSISCLNTDPASVELALYDIDPFSVINSQHSPWSPHAAALTHQLKSCKMGASIIIQMPKEEILALSMVLNKKKPSNFTIPTIALANGQIDMTYTLGRFIRSYPVIAAYEKHCLFLKLKSACEEALAE
jgi:hypothetical protein